MSRKSKKNQKWQEIQREDFDRHTTSLGDMFKDLAAQRPDLKLEGTGKRHIESQIEFQPDDASADGKDAFADEKKEQNIVTLWHGTTEGQAKEITEKGFRKSEARFTKKLSEARDLAIKKAKQRVDTPVVISCTIDLEKYRSFGKSGSNTYTFYVPTGKGAVDGAVIGKEVIRDVSVVEDGSAKKPKEADTQETIDVVVTRTSGKLGVLWWINRYLELKGEAAVDEDHPSVEAIFKWVSAQYAEGRDDPISDGEMLIQAQDNL